MKLVVEEWPAFTPIPPDSNREAIGTPTLLRRSGYAKARGGLSTVLTDF
jgi:hypothetical protein